MTISTFCDDDVADLIHIPATSLAERVHPESHLLLYQVRGRSDFHLRKEQESTPTTQHLTAGHALWLPAGVHHAVDVHENSTMLPTFYPIEKTATRLRGPVIVPVSQVLQTLILTQLQQTTTAIQPEANVARQILSLIESAPKVIDSLPTPVSPAARSIADAIRFNPGDDRSAVELAASVHMSLRTIQRHFDRETGLSLQRWRTQVRLSTAAELLYSGSSVSAIANRVGYSDVSSFCRAFKSYHGVSTSEYLKRYSR